MTSELLTSRPWMRAANFGDIVTEPAVLAPDSTALVADDVRYSYAELDRRAGGCASVLAAAGIRPGDVVGLGMGNDHRFVECLLGTLRLGAVALLLNIRLGREALRHVRTHSEAVLILGGPDATMSMDEYEARCTVAEPLTASHPVGPDDLAILMYTSGSTGVPKGVMLSHSATWWQAMTMARTMMHHRHDRGLVMGPLYHANALWCTLFPMLFVGGGVVVMPDFDAAGALERIERHRISYTSGTPSMYTLLLAADPGRDRDVSSIGLLECGSAPVSQDLSARLAARFAGDLVETYGLTEGGATILSPRWGVTKPGSAGLPVPGSEARVVREDGESCGPGEIGELWTRSPANALGYLKDPDTTAARFTPDGWLRTGDLFRRDEQGYCYFSGRTDDMIAVGGENVYPKEVERILLEHPAVADVCVVGADHATKGRAPVAWVVVAPGEQVSEQALKDHFLATGPAYAHPRRVFFLDALPLTSTNKVDRTGLERRTAEQLPTGLGASRSG